MRSASRAILRTRTAPSGEAGAKASALSCGMRFGYLGAAPYNLRLCYRGIHVSGVRVPDSPPFSIGSWAAMKRWIALLLLAASLAGAQVRSIPQDARVGQIRHLQDMVVEIDGAAQQLAPGAQIRDASNRIIVPTAIPSGTLIKYLVDANGQVHRVWILTPEDRKSTRLNS